jgi:hypothetical protein
MTANPGSDATVVGSYQAQTTGGTSPSRWNIALSTTPPAGLTATLVATGTYNGISTVDINYSGTATSTTNFFPYMDNQSYSASAGQSWTVSVYLALVGGTFPTGVSFALVSNFNISNVGVNITSPTSTLKRYTGTNTAATGVTTIGAPFFNIGVVSGTYYNYTIRLGLPQVELGAFPTSPILTGSGGSFASATRAQEQAYIPLGSWYNASAFSLLIECQKNTSADTGFSSPVGLNDGSGSHRSEFYVSPSTASLHLDAPSSGGADITAGTYTLSTPYKAAGAITGTSTTTGTMAASLNGATAVTGTNTNLDSALYTRMNIGFIGAGGNQMNGWIQRIAYWPTALTNSQLQALTG